MKIFRGQVVSDKGDKTVVVAVEAVKSHRIYRKKFAVTKKYHAHDEKNEIKTGDFVEIIESRPISKTKSWRVARKISEKEASEG